MLQLQVTIANCNKFSNYMCSATSITVAYSWRHGSRSRQTWVDVPNYARS